MPTEHPYRSYLLRLWQVKQDDDVRIWRAMVENPRTHEWQAFASLERLFAFLLEQTAQVEGPCAPNEGEAESTQGSRTANGGDFGSGGS